MKTSPFRLPLLALALCSGVVAAVAQPNTPSPEQTKAGWHSLFDGKSLDGWNASEKPGSFSVADGCIAVQGPRSHLFYAGPVNNHDFKNFELQAEIKTFPKANSGVYFHTQFQQTGWPAKGYEVQVNNSHTDWRRTAGLYAIQDNKTAPAPDETWFTMRIRVEGKHITTWVNEKIISDYTEEEKPAREANMAGRLISHGTFALQGHDPGSRVLYRNIFVRTLP